jgi:hypothetical protein
LIDQEAAVETRAACDALPPAGASASVLAELFVAAFSERSLSYDEGHPRAQAPSVARWLGSAWSVVMSKR